MMDKLFILFVIIPCSLFGQWKNNGNDVRFSPTPSKDSVFVMSSSSKTDLINGYGEWSANILPYKVYTVLVNQSNNDAPIPNILQNTTGITPYWYRDTPSSTGGFSVLFEGISSTNVFVILSPIELNNQYAFDYGHGLEGGDLVVSFHCYDATSNGGVPPYDLINGAFNNKPIEIRIYD